MYESYRISQLIPYQIISFSNIKYQGIDKIFKFYLFEYTDISDFYISISKCPKYLSSSFTILSNPEFKKHLPYEIDNIREEIQISLNSNDYKRINDLQNHLKMFFTNNNNTDSNHIIFEGQINSNMILISNINYTLLPLSAADLIKCYNQKEYSELSIYISCDIDDGLDGYTFQCSIKQFELLINSCDLNIISFLI